VCNRGPSTRHRHTGGKKAASWAPSIAQVWREMQNCYDVRLHPRRDTGWRGQSPSPDSVDDEGGVPSNEP
jgi:hypothetical protein